MRDVAGAQMFDAAGEPALADADVRMKLHDERTNHRQETTERHASHKVRASAGGVIKHGKSGGKMSG